MTSSRLVRGAKTRMFAFICLVFVLGALVYIFHGTQSRLSEIQQQAGVCSQQLESLNAQMQVILEYKLRLATTLNKEKEDHRQTKETLEKKLKEEKEKWEKESLETKNKYAALVQKNNMLQGQLEDVKEKFSEVEEERKKGLLSAEDLRKELEVLKTEKKESIENLKTELLQKTEEINALQKKLTDEKSLTDGERNSNLEKENEDLKKQLSLCQNKPLPLPAASTSPKTEAKNVGAQPDNIGEMPKMGNSNISTPGINPMAVGDLSSVKPLPEADPAQRKLDEQIKVPSKKPTQESVVPLAQPGKFEQGLAQIPGPPDHRTNTLHKPKTNDQVNEEMNNNIIADEPEDPLLRDQQEKGQVRGPYMPLNGMAGESPVLGAAGMDVEGVGQQPQPAAEREEEEEGGGEVNINNQVPHKNPDNYHGGDYDKEQPEEEDDEAEQIDYEAERSVKEGGAGRIKLIKNQKIANHNGGIMINPK